MMKTKSAQYFLTLLVGIMMLAGCTSASPTATSATDADATSVAQLDPTTAALPTPAPLPRTSDGAILASGRIVPIRSAEIAPQSSQVVSEVLVKEGDLVVAGDPLIKFDTSAADLRVREAEARLAEARAGYQQLLDGATEEQIAASQAEINRARAELKRVNLAVGPEEVTAAESALAEAQAELNRLLKPPTEDDIAVFRSRLENAQVQLQATRDSLAADKLRAETRMDQAANGLREAQSAYERIYWELRGGSTGAILSPEEEQAQTAAQRAVDNAQLDLEAAQLSYEEARKLEEAGVQSALAEVVEAQAYYDMLFEPKDPVAIEAAQKRVDQVRIRLEQLRGERFESNLDIARANVEYNEALLAELTAAPKPSLLASSEAQVMRAEVILEQQKLELTQAFLHAPFDGQVVKVSVQPGLSITPDTTALLLADMSSWRIQIDDVNELDIVSIREGDRAIITFLALPGYRVEGKVSYVELIGKQPERQSGARYQILIEPEDWDDRLRWNMTATVAIMASQQ